MSEPEELMCSSRYNRTDYLLETVADFNDPEALMWDIIGAMSDQEYHSIYLYICRMRDIEPDEDKHNAELV